MFLLWKGIAVFWAMILVDICWAKYMLATSERKAFLAGLWSAVIMLLGGLTVLGYTENKILLIPAALGAFIGTFIGVKHE